MTEPNTEKPTPGDAAAEVHVAAPERRDAEGIPLDRDATLDDVRGGANHFKFAVGCSAVVVLLIVGFWVLRVMLAR
jgi:hypothetical protein